MKVVSQRDSYNCGPFAWKALMHLHFPFENPLPESDGGALIRAEAFIAVAKAQITGSKVRLSFSCLQPSNNGFINRHRRMLLCQALHRLVHLNPISMAMISTEVTFSYPPRLPPAQYGLPQALLLQLPSSASLIQENLESPSSFQHPNELVPPDKHSSRNSLKY